MTTPPESWRGPARTLVERVLPSVDGGRFPVKRVLGDPLEVTAWVLCDGHDALSVRLRYRRWDVAEWSERPMKLRYNDEWTGSFLPDSIGFWEYQVVAWVNEFLSWRQGFIKKWDGGQSVTVELEIGAALVRAAAERAPAEAAETLGRWALFLVDDGIAVRERVDLVLSSAFAEEVDRYPDRSWESSHELDLPLLVERERALYGSWYEFFPRSWGHTPGEHGTFASAARLLPEIARMGFQVVYLPPIHPIGRTFRKGRNNALVAAPDDVGSPWAIGSEEGGHKAVHPALGTEKDFQDFIWKAGELGMEVAMDVAFQCSPDHPYVRQHPQWFKWRPDGSVQYAENPPKKYQDILPFNFETPDWQALWEELRSVFLYWVERGVKIFRVDNPHTKPLEFWRWCLGTIKESHPEVIFLAEAFTRPKLKYRLAKVGFTQGYTYFTWRNSRDELTEYLRELTEGAPSEFFWPNFWPNTPDILHDYLVRGGRAAHIVRVVLAATLSSNFGLYGPAFELCQTDPFPGKEEYNHNEKYEIKHWSWDAPGNLKWLLARLNRIRRENRALQRTRNLKFLETENPHLIAYLKSTPEGSNHVLTVVNLDPFATQTGWVTLPLAEMGIPPDRPFLVQDMLPEHPGPLPRDNYLWQGPRNYVKLDPGHLPAHVLRVFRESRREQDFDYWA